MSGYKRIRSNVSPDGDRSIKICIDHYSFHIIDKAAMAMDLPVRDVLRFIIADAAVQLAVAELRSKENGEVK